MPDAHAKPTGDSALPPPVVPPDAYDTPYFAHTAAGHDDWGVGSDHDLGPQYAGFLRLIDFRAGETLVDVGCGRGELVAVALRAGAARAVGVDYSESALDFARQLVSAEDRAAHGEVLLADARGLPVESGVADVVTLLEVVEHLAPEELAQTLLEARRVLRPGGRLLVHTLPNRLIYDVGYRALRLAFLGRWRGWPVDPRNEHELLMHVNEQTLGSTRRALRDAGFTDLRVWAGDWVHHGIIPSALARRISFRMARTPGLRQFGAGNIFATARAPLTGPKSAPSAT